MRKITISLLIVTIALVASALQWYRPRRVVHSDLHPLYLHFEHRDSVVVGFVNDLKIDKGVTIDCVTIQCSDSASFYSIAAEMEIPEELVNTSNHRDSNSFVIFNISKEEHDYLRVRDSVGKYDVVVCRPSMKSFCIYDVRTAQQDSITIEREFDIITNIQQET